MTTTLHITVPVTRVLEDHAEYGVSCTPNYAPNNPNSVLVWRRYRDFEHLRQTLHRVAPALLLPNLPGKHSWWSSRSAPIVNERQRQFETFLHEVEAGLERPGPAWNVFCQFVGAPATALSGVLPMTRRESDDPTFVLKDEVLRLQNHISMMEDEDAKLRMELDSRENEIATLRGKRLDVKQTKEQTAQLEREKNQMIVEIARLEALLNSAGEAQHDLNALKEDNTKLRSEITIVEGEKNELKSVLMRHEELVESLRREIARLEDEVQRMQKEIATLQKQLEANPNEQPMREELAQLKKEKGQLELEITKLETAQQSAAAYGASVLAKLEKVEKEKLQQVTEAKGALESELKISAFQRERIAELEQDLRAAREALVSVSRDVDVATGQTQEVLAANELLKVSIEGEESELMTLRNEVKFLHDQLARVSAEYEMIKVKSDAGNGEIEKRLEEMGKLVIDLRAENDTNMTVKKKLAARVETLVLENEHLKTKNSSLERRMKLLQGD